MYKTTYTIEVLSQEEIPPWMSMEKVIYECDAGEYVVLTVGGDTEEVTDAEMADLLYEAGSEPLFFGLNDDGTPADDDYDQLLGD